MDKGHMGTRKSTALRISVNQHLWREHGRLFIPGKTAHRIAKHEQLHSLVPEEWNHTHTFDGDPAGSMEYLNDPRAV